ncbi:MAG: starch-binding protein [Paludibacteraceae bacterium]|nr:starch-binding protein [Paludibacteraceae bacterium]
MRKTLLMLLTLMLSTFGWSATNYNVSVSTSDYEAGYVTVDITNGDVDGETYHDTEEYGDYTEFEVRSGRKMKLTAVVNDESLYRFVKWEDNSTKNPRSVTVKSDQNIKAYFEAIPTYFVYANAQPAGAVSEISVSASESVDEGDGYAEVYEGTTVTMEIDPDYITAGYRFIGWYDGEELISSDYSCQITSGAADKTYTAKFEEIPTFTITIAKNIDGGEASVWLWSGEEADGDDDFGSWITVNENSEVYLYAEASEGYRFLGWFIGDEMVYGPESEKQEMSFVPTKNETYTAKFEEIPTYTITVDATPDNVEDVYVYIEYYDSQNPTQYDQYETAEGTTNAALVFMEKEGWQVSVYAEYYDGDDNAYNDMWSFKEWSDGVTDNPRIFTPTQDEHFTAVFEYHPNITITTEADPDDGGYTDVSVVNDADDLNPDDDYQSVTVKENVEVELWSEARVGYRFLGWYYNGELVNENEVWRETVTANKTFTAKYEKKPGITIDVVGWVNYGEVNVNVMVGAGDDEDDLVPDDGNDKTVSVREGATVYIYAPNVEGYKFKGWDQYTYDDQYVRRITVSPNVYYSFIPNESGYYYAVYEKVPVNYYILSSNSEPQNGGTVTMNVVSGTWSDHGDGWIEVKQGSVVRLTAQTNDGFRFVRWSDGNTEQSRTVTVSGNKTIYAIFELDPEAGGYEQIGTTDLYSKSLSKAIDIKGVDYDKIRVYQSTYDNEGYQGAIQVNGGEAQFFNPEGTEIDGVYVEAHTVQSGMLARVVYVVSNGNDQPATVSLGTYADVQIGDEDGAPIEKITDVEGKTFGVVMKDGKGGQLYVSFGMGVAGLSLIDDYWFGMYNNNSDPEKIVGNYDTGFEGYMEENGNYDSGMGWCWKNRTIQPGESLTFSFLVGIGEVVLKPTCSIELTPVNANTWNDVATAHTMVVEGLYDHSAGLDGRIQYAVEELPATDEGWITLPVSSAWIKQGDHFNANIDVNFNPAKAIHTIHFRSMDILGNVASIPSVQYEDIRSLELTGEVVDKVYTGSALTQNVALAGLETNKYSVRYTNNVNAGTAHMFFEGVYPNTIGRKEYSFTISPKPLEGEIVFYNNEVVYDGEAHQPGWHFSEGYHLTEGVDYTATWNNNILPGNGKLTIKGKGNYTGTLSATFQIKKIAVTSDMYSVKLPLSCQYDGEAHVATAQTIDGVGAATFTYLVNGVAQEPVDGGIYDVVLSIAEGEFYYGISDVPVGTFTIWRMDAAEWTALQAIYAELSVRNWKNRWDMSKGEAGAGSFQGVTFNQGHVVELNLSENEIDGTFPLSVLSLPYMTSLDLSNNSLSGDIEDGIIEYVQAHPIAAPARAKAEENTITVYVQKPAEWSGMNVYSWTDNAELTHSWPGDPMSDRGDGWWVYSGLPVGANVVFNDGTGNPSMQTGDITNIQYSTAYTLQASTGHTSMGDVPYTVASAVVVQNGIILPKGLKTVNISHNELEGNIGLFAQALPKLEALDASYNHIAEVVPMLSTGITNLDLSNQVVLAPRVLDLEAAATDYTNFIASIPTVMLYNHEAQDYTLNSSTLVTIQDGLSNPQFAASAVVVDFENKLWTMNSNGQDNVFRYTSEDVLYVTNEGSTSRFSAKLLFGDGDANFTGTTDVLDLQASINFIFGEYDNARPYNFTAANLFKDEVINVQDIVLLTNILLADEEPSPTPARRMMAAQAEGTEAEAELRWERGELHLMSNKPVAALDLVIETDEPIEWQAGAHSVMTKQTRNGQHAVIYSLAGAVFAAGTDIVIARAKDLTPRTTKAVLADKEAMPITVRTYTEGANVPTGVDNVQSDNVPCIKVLRDGVLYIIHNGTMYNVQGQLIKK